MARVINFKGARYHSAPLFYDLKVLDIFKEYRYVIGIFMHDIIYNHLPHTLYDYFSMPEHRYQTRNKENSCLCFSMTK